MKRLNMEMVLDAATKCAKEMDWDVRSLSGRDILCVASYWFAKCADDAGNTPTSKMWVRYAHMCDRMMEEYD